MQTCWGWALLGFKEQKRTVKMKRCLGEGVCIWILPTVKEETLTVTKALNSALLYLSVCFAVGELCKKNENIL